MWRCLLKDLILNTLKLVFWVQVVIFVTMMMSITENASFLRIMFEVVSAFGTVGLSTGITTSLTDYGKVWLIATMLLVG